MRSVFILTHQWNNQGANVLGAFAKKEDAERFQRSYEREHPISALEPSWFEIEEAAYYE